MTEVPWACYPQTAAMPIARTWLQMQADLQLAPKTIDAYGRALDDYLSFCRTVDQSPEAAPCSLPGIVPFSHSSCANCSKSFTPWKTLLAAL